AATRRDVPRRAEELDLGRREVHRDRVARHRAVAPTERPPEVVPRPHLEPRVTLAETEPRALEQDGNLDAAPERTLLLGDDRRVGALDGGRRQAGGCARAP